MLYFPAIDSSLMAIILALASASALSLFRLDSSISHDGYIDSIQRSMLPCPKADEMIPAMPTISRASRSRWSLRMAR